MRILIKFVGIIVGIICVPIGYIVGFVMRPVAVGWVLGYTHLGNLEVKSLKKELDKRNKEKPEGMNDDEILRFLGKTTDGTYGGQPDAGLH